MKVSHAVRIAGVAVMAAVALAACGGRQASTNAEPADPPSTPGPAAPASLAVDQDMLASIRVDTIRDREMPSTLVVGGKVQFDEDRLARVLAPLSGQIVDLRVKVGDVVRKGQTLCRVSSRDVTAALGDHVDAHKDLDLAEKTDAMTRDLFDHEAASRIALQQAQNDLAKARARVARSEEALRVLGLRDEATLDTVNGRIALVSPLDGAIIERKVTEGQFVQTDGTPLITVADLSHVWVLGDIFERDLHLVSRRQAAIVTASAYPGQAFEGRVDYVSDVIDPATRAAKVRVSVPNPGGRLKPEMFASISLGVGAPQHVLTIPSRAAFTEGGRTWVYVLTAPRQFVRRAVDLEQDEGADRRVRAGLRAGDRIVVDGALLLRGEEEKRAG